MSSFTFPKGFKKDKLTVVSDNRFKRPGKDSYFITVKCECGYTYDLSIPAFRSSRYKHCPECKYKETLKKIGGQCGSRYNKWTIIDDEIKTNKFNAKLVHVRCDCGNTAYLPVFVLKKMENGCKKCYKRKPKKFKDISLAIFNSIKHQANRRNFAFDITPEYLWELFLKQNGRCALSGTTLKMPLKRKGIQVDDSTNEFNGEEFASLDRIDSRLGYIKGNVQWVAWIYNQMKMDIPNSRFIENCKKVYEYSRKDN